MATSRSTTTIVDEPSEGLLHQLHAGVPAALHHRPQLMHLLLADHAANGARSDEYLGGQDPPRTIGRESSWLITPCSETEI